MAINEGIYYKLPIASLNLINDVFVDYPIDNQTKMTSVL